MDLEYISKISPFSGQTLSLDQKSGLEVSMLQRQRVRYMRFCFENWICTCVFANKAFNNLDNEAKIFREFLKFESKFENNIYKK